MAERRRRIATNPPFTLLVDLLKLCLPLLGDDAVLALFGLTQWGQAEDHHETLDLHRPYGQARVGGRVRFRSGLNPRTGRPWSADAREYCQHPLRPVRVGEGGSWFEPAGEAATAI